MDERPSGRRRRPAFTDPRRIREALPSPEDLRRVRHRWHRVLVLATLTGVLVGLAVAAFEALVDDWLLAWTFDLPIGAQVVAPAVGLGLAWLALRYVGRRATPAAADEFLEAYHDRDGDVPLREVPGKTAAAGATLGLGGSMGFEGPSIYLGATIGSAIRRRFPRSFETADRRLLLVAGAAAGVSAIFKAPATGAVFALEVPYRDDSASHTAVPAIVAAAASYLVFVGFYGVGRLFPVGGDTPPLDARDLLGALAMGLLAGLGARLFSHALHRAKAAAAAPRPGARLLITGLVLAAVAGLTYLVYDAPLSLGPGFEAVEWAKDPTRSLGLVLALLVIRAVATGVTMAGGGVGGVFIPLFVQGWLLGTAVEIVVNSDTLLFPVIGAAAFLGAGYRTPIAAVVFVAESTGRPGFVVPALLATAVAQVVMGGRSVTRHQLARRLDRLERRAQLPIGAALVRVTECVPDLPLTAVLRRMPTDSARVVAVVEAGRFLGLVDRDRAAAFVATRGAGARAREAVIPAPVVAGPGWTVGDARDALADAPGGVVAVLDGIALLGVVTPQSILDAERDLR